ncbi:interleukin-2 receptor subunit beta-like isoform X2 [Cynoglossus semilaevis]|uniref:interleukin-2 receptor subunit beta-like isoform X2 n=1 Tax=Cynoglossus semilaevis TaxID=244447 RepID=UPI000D62AF45|nr:interleukin-2 receptor subunit beta-like isoform X2 [Cynoglossus semilaevis]
MLVVQLTAPRGLEIHRMPEAINITWESGYENHPYLRNSLDYELLISRKLDSSKRMTLQKTFKSILRERLEAPATYCFKVRSKAFVRDYSGTWSEWSSKICGDFAKEEQDNILLTLTTYLGPVFVTVGFLLVAFLSPSARMKMNIFSIPSPAPFFKPLLQHHEGNVKEWLSPWGNFALTHESDEILTIVSIEPKVTEINSEEIKESWDSSLTPLTLTKCQNSYVCVPKTTELSLTIPSNHTDQNPIG